MSHRSSTFECDPHARGCARRRFIADNDAWLTKTKPTARFSVADIDAAALTVATAEICFCWAPGITTPLTSRVYLSRKLPVRRSRAAVKSIPTVQGDTTASRSCPRWPPAPTVRPPAATREPSRPPISNTPARPTASPVKEARRRSARIAGRGGPLVTQSSLSCRMRQH